MYDFRQFYIDGKWVDPIEPRALEVIDPATEKPVGQISMGTAADVAVRVAVFSTVAITSASRTSRPAARAARWP